MAERRYGFRLAAKDASSGKHLGFFFSVFLLVSMLEELKHKAEHMSSVRLTVTGEGAAANSSKKAENSAAVLQPPTTTTADKPKTVVVVTSSTTGTSSDSCSFSELFLNRSSEKNSTPKPTFPQNLQTSLRI